MIKLKDLLFEKDLPKDKWVRLKGKDLEDHAKEIWKIIKSSYAPIGGHPTYTSAKDVTTAKDVKFWQVVDIDGDGDVDATLSGKIRKSNVKIGMSATDGTKPAKRSLVHHRASLLKKTGYFAETSGRPAEVSLAMGLHVVNDEELIRSMVLKGETRDFKWLKDGWYQRRLKDGRLVKKIMIGYPK